MDLMGGRGAVLKADLALRQEAGDPFAGGRLAHLGGVGRLAQRPTFFDDTFDRSPRLFRLSAALAWSFIRSTSLRLGGLDTPSLQGGPDETTGSGITARPRDTARAMSQESASAL